MTILGDTIIHASTEKAAEGSDGNAVGILANANGAIDLTAGHTNITVDVGTSRAYG